MALLPADLPTGLVTGHFLFVSHDQVDDDTDPEMTVVTGDVTFTCSSVDPIRVVDDDLVLVPLQFKGSFNSQGYLVPNGGTGVGIELPASDSLKYNPNGFTWRVDFKLTEVGSLNVVPIKSFDIFVTESSDPLVNSLSKLMPIYSSGGVPIVVGPPGPLGPEGPIGPTPQISVGTVDVGTPVPVIGPQGIQGPKGDPGGIVLGTNLPAGTDLDNIKTDGVYRFTTAISNLPPRLQYGYGVLYVNSAESGFRVVHTIYPGAASQNGAVFYQRAYSSGVWTAWRTFNSTRVDQTAGRAIYQWDDLNNREQLIYGDTGLREITSLLGYGTVNSIYIRRYGSEVEIIFLNFSRPGTDTTPRTLLTVPAGFKPSNGMPIHPLFQTSGIAAMIDISGSSGALTSTVYPAAGSYYGRIKYMTTDAWPTTLPGTAVGTIPNL